MIFDVFDDLMILISILVRGVQVSDTVFLKKIKRRNCKIETGSGQRTLLLVPLVHLSPIQKTNPT